MQQYKALVASMMKMQFSAGMKTKNNKKSSTIASYIILGALLLLFGVILGFSSVAYGAMNDMYGFVVTMSFIVFLITLVFGLIFLVGNLYFDKKASFYLALPVSQTKIFFSKLTVSYLFQLLFGVMLFVPSVIVAGILNNLGAQFYIFGIIGSLLLPFVSLLIAAVLSLPIAYFIGFLKKFTKVFMAIRVIFFVMIFIAYILFIVSMTNSVGEGDEVVTAPNWILTLALVIYPINSLAAAMTMTPIFGISGVGAAFINMGLFLIVIIVAMIVCYMLTRALYFNAITKQFENVVEKKSATVKRKAVAEENRSIGSTFLRRDISSITSNGSMLATTIMQMLMMPFMAVVMVVSMNSAIGGAIDATESNILISILYSILMFFLFYNFNYASSTAFSRDAKVFNLYFTLPIDYKVYIKSKVVLHLEISLVSPILSSIIVSIVAFHPIYTPFYILTALSAAMLSCVFGLWYNLKKPVLNWTNMSELTHNSKPVLVPMLTFMGYGLVITIISLLLGIMLGGTLGTVLSGIIFFLAAVIPLIVFSFKLKNDALTLLDKFRD